jgi:hypothetical protein
VNRPIHLVFDQFCVRHNNLRYPLNTHNIPFPCVGVKRINAHISAIQYLVGVGERRIGKKSTFTICQCKR